MWFYNLGQVESIWERQWLLSIFSCQICSELIKKMRVVAVNYDYAIAIAMTLVCYNSNIVCCL